jgi:S-adenosylmethionine:tRNA ribosyltransferase-isomerase
VKTRSFSFRLPRDRIAQQPLAQRDRSRLLVLERASGRITHRAFSDLPDLLEPGTLVLLNDSRVRKARLFARAEAETESPSGGKAEFLLLEELQPGLWKTLAARARKQRPGKRYRFPGGVTGAVVAWEGAAKEGEGPFRFVRFDPPISEQYLEEHGHVPLPPYIDRADSSADAERYQTVYARTIGSAAAPTAGLHLTPELLRALEARGATVAALTLHVGTGTFLPIRSEDIEEHRMHEERYEVPEATARTVNQALSEGGKILAVGTTVVRAVESACREGMVAAGAGRTSLFIKPGFRFQVVSQLLTNFHTPRSTLLVLVSAFAGRGRVLRAYREALARGYRFYSYGDAMLIR